MAHSTFATVLLAALAVAACGADPELDRSWMGSADGQPLQVDEPVATQEGEDGEGLDEPKSKKKKKKKKSSDDDERDDDEGGEADEEDAIDYPKMSFTGRGDVTNDGRILAMEMATYVEIDDNHLVFDTRRAKVHYHERDHQKKVDEKVNRNSIGRDVFVRTPKSDLKSDDRLKEAMKWAVFADQATNKKGVTFRFSSPLPVYPWPATESRYEALSRETFQATVTTDQLIAASPELIEEDDDDTEERLRDARRNPVFKQLGKVRDTFNVTVTVSKQSLGGGQAVLVFEMTIAEDNQGILYEQFPLPKRAVYTIDTEEKVVMSAQMTGLTYGDRSRRQETSQMPMQICTREQGGKTRNYTCHPF